MNAWGRDVMIASLLLGLLVTSSQASAATIAIDPDEPVIELSGHLEYLEDAEHSLLLAEDAMASAGWVSANGEVPSLGITKSAYWFRVTLEYGYGSEPLDRIVEVSYSDISKVYYWALTAANPSPEPVVSGSELAVMDRVIPVDKFAFPLTLQPGQPVTLLFRCMGDDSLMVPLKLYNTYSHTRKEQDERTYEGIFYGILLAMLLYNVFLYLSIRERAYIYYCLYIVATLMLQMIMDGSADIYIFPEDDTNFGEKYGFTRRSIGIIVLSLALFTRDFLHLPERSPLQDRMMIFFAFVGGLIIFVSPFFLYADVFTWVLVASVLGALTILAVGVFSLVSGYPPARFFMLAFGAYLVAVLFMIGGLFGVFTHSFWIHHAMQIGSAAQVTLLSLALAYRIKHSEAARDLAEREALEHERTEAEAKRQLEHNKQLLIQNEKLANLGVMISGLGHEIANPINAANMSLAAIEIEIEDLKQQLDPLFDDSEAAQTFKGVLDEKFGEIGTTCGYMKDATNRLKDLSGALRAQSRGEKYPTDSVNINDVISESIVITRAKTASMEVKSELGALPPIRCYRTQVGQVATNLISNAADALAERKAELGGNEPFHGQIVVTTEESGREEIAGVLITVSDNGNGVPDAIRDEIFDQFFTTKDSGVGTGLGLSLCASIVNDHDGTMEVDNSPTLGGARFRVWLPLEGGAKMNSATTIE